MIYFLLHNNIHLMDAEEHLKNLKGHDTTLIKIPHKLTIEPSHKFNNKLEYPILIRRRRDYINFIRIKNIHSKIKHDLANVNADDILIFYTEFETLSHYIITLFKEKNATVIMLDEGFPTYQSLLNPDSKLKISDKILMFYLKYVLKYMNTIVTRYNGIIRPRLMDEMIDMVLLYNEVIVERDLKIELLDFKIYTYKSPDTRKIVFLNERVYDYYVSFNKYLDILEDILRNLTNQLEIVYFKFHPREGKIDREKILPVINKFNGRIIIINEDKPIELLIDDLQIKYIASFFAQTLLFHSHSNCTCLYLFHKYEILMRNPVLLSVKRTLHSLNYKFINEWSDIHNKEIGFQVLNDGISLTLKGHLNL